MKVLVTGASGFVGQRVVKQLLGKGDEVVVLTRNIVKAALYLGKECKFYNWDTNELPPEEAFHGVDAVINLMGEGIAEKRWDEAQKKKIYDSRIIGTSMLIERIKGLDKKPSVFISASGTGIYGNRGDEVITEGSSVADDFLAKVCKDWEAEANKAKDLGLRVVILRTGVVLGKNGGALKKMLTPFKLGVGGPVASGKQYMSWIHVEDLAGIYVQAVRDASYSGVYNGTSPNPVTNKEFTKELGKAVGRPAFFPVPAFALKAAFGEMSQVLLDGQKVLPSRVQEKKFRFRYPIVEMAIKESIR